MRRLYNPILAIIALTTFTLTATAQSTPTWPEPYALPTGTRILITTFADPNESFPCVVHTIDSTQVACIGHHSSTDTHFDRAAISTIYLTPHHHIRVSTLLIAAGSACLLLAYLIFVGHHDSGGSANGELAQVGLTVLIAGGITRFFDGNHDSHMEVPIYTAPRQAASTPALEP